jgi:hypothetical protein
MGRMRGIGSRIGDWGVGIMRGEVVGWDGRKDEMDEKDTVAD